MKNRNLNKAKQQKNDEFYTQYKDVKKEVERYADQLKGKIIFCNCDNPEQSNFYKYFYDNFDILGLKELISSNADFRSEESIKMLKDCDIVITNPPFSLFREYIAQLMEYDKKFLIIGNNNAITYKEIFTYIKANRLWLGYTSNKTMGFQLGDDYDKWNYIKDNKKYGNVPAISWFTNLDNEKRHINLVRDVLYKKYTPAEYPKYDNFNAINVDKTKDIPLDYFGVIGVPITYFDKHNPDQFEIIGNEYELNIQKGRGYINGKRMYSRLFIKRK